ncbi:MAG: tetratricopeptide repeat protein, partial [Candidatus Electryoneaceae bacterium]|nr:tetratricopeptide repeat protein [Candidatus Electryoneaceae bacterium]
MFREILLERFNHTIIYFIVMFFLGTLSSIAVESPSEMLARAEQLKQGGVVMEAITVYRQYVGQVPDDHEARISLVEMLLDMRQKEQAIQHIQKLRQVKHDDPRVRRFIIIADEFISSRRQRQVESFENSVRQGNASPATLLKYARYLGGDNQPTQAIKIYKRYLATNPNNNAARLEMAKQLAWTRQYSRCLSELNLLLTRNQNNIRARILLGDIYYWQSKEELALNAYRRVLEVSPNHRGVKQKINQIITTPGYREEQLIQALESDPEGELLNDLSSYYLESGREYEADSLARKRLRFAPNDTIAIQLVGVIEQHRLERLAVQIARYKEILSRMPRDTTARLHLARHYAAVPEFTVALDHYNRYMEQYPMDYWIRLERAKILSWSGDPESAVEEFRIVTIALPDNRESRIGLGEALLIANLNLDEAEEIFREDLEDHPDDIRSHLGYADALRRQGKNPKARSEYETILEADSSHQDALRGLYLLSHDVGPLMLQLERQLADNPDNLALKRRLAGLYFDAERFYEAEKLVLDLIVAYPDAMPLQQFMEEIRLSKVRFQTRELQDAKLAVQEHSDDLDIRMNYAEILAVNGRYEDAVAQFRLILEHRPDDQKLAVKIAELL